LKNLSSTDLSERETGQGVKHVGKAISQLVIKLLLNGSDEKIDTRIKPILVK
jgi:hypothetical protein